MGAGSVQYPEPHMGAFKTAEHPAGLAPVSVRRDFQERGSCPTRHAKVSASAAWGMARQNNNRQKTMKQNKKTIHTQGGLIA